jgi:hypothetical protein
MTPADLRIEHLQHALQAPSVVLFGRSIAPPPHREGSLAVGGQSDLPLAVKDDVDGVTAELP